MILMSKLCISKASKSKIQTQKISINSYLTLLINSTNTVLPNLLVKNYIGNKIRALAKSLSWGCNIQVFITFNLTICTLGSFQKILDIELRSTVPSSDHLFIIFLILIKYWTYLFHHKVNNIKRKLYYLFSNLVFFSVGHLDCYLLLNFLSSK
jgi:Na+-transporting NADH:ubiquinone oxidoreductase subunit NqrE